MSLGAPTPTPEQSSVWEALSLASLCHPPINKDGLSSYFVPRAVLEKEFKAVNKTDKDIPPDIHEYCYLDLTRVLVGDMMTKSKQWSNSCLVTRQHCQASLELGGCL